MPQFNREQVLDNLQRMRAEVRSSNLVCREQEWRDLQASYSNPNTNIMACCGDWWVLVWEIDQFSFPDIIAMPHTNQFVLRSNDDRIPNDAHFIYQYYLYQSSNLKEVRTYLLLNFQE